MLNRHDRRRRVLADEMLSETDASGERAGAALPAESGKRYSSAVERENQTRVVDLVPVTGWAFSLVMTLGVLLIGGLVFAHISLPKLAKLAPSEMLEPLDLTARHSLAHWFASLLLLTNVQFALVVYSVRRHRVDDYHGRYRVWLAVALVSLAVSLDFATGISGLIKLSLAPLARKCGVAEHYGFWAAVGLVGSYVSIRLFLEVRRAWPTMIALLFAASGCIVPAMLTAGWLPESWNQHEVIIHATCQLVTCLSVLGATSLFMRHVFLDIEGKIPAKKRVAKKPKVKKAAAKTAETVVKAKPQTPVRTDLDSPKPSPLAAKLAAARPAVVTKPSVQEDDEDEDEEESGEIDMRNLSRAERKRLKRDAKLAARRAA